MPNMAIFNPLCSRSKCAVAATLGQLHELQDPLRMGTVCGLLVI